MRRDDGQRNWRLYCRALDLLERGAKSRALPTLRALAARHFAPAMNLLSDHVTDAEALRMLRRGARLGDDMAADNLAITHLNRGDLLHYRLSLARAARHDEDSACELRRFKRRFPHSMMARFRMLEPDPD
jgi:hypothetical protein